jgi:hypothetical protein
MADTEVVDIEDCYVTVETDKAILVQLPNLDEEWIPKSQIDEDSEVKAEGDEGTITVTRWIAEQKGIDDLDEATTRSVGP